MRAHTSIRILMAAGVLAIFCLATAEAEVETWTSRAGSEVKAEYVEMDNNVVTLRTEDGQLLQIGLAALSPESQKRIAALEDEKKGGIGKLGPIERLTTIIPESYLPANNEVIGTYEHKLFDAFFYSPLGRVDIFVKEDGKYLTEPIRVGLDVWYYDSAKKKWPRRKVLGTLETPRYSRNQVHYKLELEDDVYAEVFCSAEKNKVMLSYKVKDPSGITYASAHRLQATFAPLFKEHAADKLNYNPRYTDGLTWEQINATVSSYTVEIGGRDGNRVIYPYDKGIQTMKTPAGSAEIKGPYGPRVIDVSVSEKGGHLQPYIYRGYAPVTGYSLSYVKADPNTSATAKDKIMTIAVE